MAGRKEKEEEFARLEAAQRHRDSSKSPVTRYIDWINQPFFSDSKPPKATPRGSVIAMVSSCLTFASVAVSVFFPAVGLPLALLFIAVALFHVSMLNKSSESISSYPGTFPVKL